MTKTHQNLHRLLIQYLYIILFTLLNLIYPIPFPSTYLFNTIMGKHGTNATGTKDINQYPLVITTNDPILLTILHRILRV